MAKYFGTDGVRGIANVELTPALAFRIGEALAHSLGELLGRKPKVCIGRDTRISGDMLECAIAAGITSRGGDVWLLGVMPTPAVAYLTKEERMDAGIVISASHNPFEHNGIKIFGGSGYKLDDEREEELEALMDGELPKETPRGGALGRVYDHKAEGCQRYSEHVRACAEGDLSGLRVLFDCANGAASQTARMIFEPLGVQCDFIACAPDGVNINNGCGSTHMETLCEKVRAGGYDLGAAFDGDADRCLLCDETGELIDGDDILALLAVWMKEKGALRRGVVATVMSNMGLGGFLRPQGIDVTAVKVGDRHVLEEMLASDSNLGGEQSGHVILTDYATTGDGELTAVRFLSMLAEVQVKASVLRQQVYHYPQKLINVEVPNLVKKQITDVLGVKALEQRAKELFGGDGRINVRPSGTEALVRVMVEGKDPSLVEQMAEEGRKAVEQAAKVLLMSRADY